MRDRIVSDDGTVTYIKTGEGRKRPRPYRNPKEPWTFKLPTDQIIELYTTGELAKRLDKSYQSTWRMIRRSEIPATPFKHPNGDKLYSTDQISLIVECAKEFDLRNGVSVKSTGFIEALERRHHTLLVSYGLKKT
jgi:hypothetical protein